MPSRQFISQRMRLTSSVMAKCGKGRVEHRGSIKRSSNKMVRPTGVCEFRNINDLDASNPSIGAIDRKKLFQGMSNPEPPPNENAAPTAMGSGAKNYGKAGSSSTSNLTAKAAQRATAEYGQIGLIWSVGTGTFQLFGFHRHTSVAEGDFRDPGDALMAACMLMNQHPDAPLTVTKIGGVS